ncbi:hypothetical protein [Sphingomonas abietis]|uniref:STAS/SEC14 domain-containing protein n=1 Tax=Sphingomonas abietis TaxID=3012344 RepID=A0ABY7NRP2_9SPHN|nr:hypothetical protein [Sphingomonas abietis]WBO23475.1 hypothetical protein PBT88_04925 [Sphingomonas abietis]
MAGEMSVQFDVGTGKICVYGNGFWSFPQATAFFDDWKQIIRRIHAAGLPVSAFVDMTESGVQKADVAQLIATATLGLYRDGDAIAMLVPNSLAKMQMRRVLEARFHGFFISRSAATTWLAGRAFSRDYVGRGASSG